MDIQEKVKLLQSLRLLEHIPADKLAALAGYLEPRSYEENGVVFEEGSKGDTLFFVSSGRVRIMKKVLQADGTPAFKDLAILHAGDCFGEMALFDEVPRSARAMAGSDCVLFELDRKKLHRWLESNPRLAVGFFTELVGVLSRRLRRSSNELALLFDLSQWLLEPISSGKALLQKVLSHLVPHLEGTWTAGAYLYNEFNDELELVATEGNFESPADPKPSAAVLPAEAESQAGWADDRSYHVSFPGKARASGHLILRSGAALGPEEKNEVARTLATTARLIAPALENISFRTEDALRERLAATRSYGRGI